MLYAIGWTLLIAFTLLISLAAFLWGCGTGQFSDQKRASWLPLVDARPCVEEVPAPRRPAEIYVMMLCGILVACALAASVLLGLKII